MRVLEEKCYPDCSNNGSTCQNKNHLERQEHQNKTQNKTIMRALVITIFLHACETWTLIAELQRSIQSLEFRCFRKILGISYKDRVTKHNFFYRTLRRYPGNCKAAKTEMVLARDKIGLLNQSDTTGNSRRQAKKRQAEKELD